MVNSKHKFFSALLKKDTLASHVDLTSIEWFSLEAKRPFYLVEKLVDAVEWSVVSVATKWPGIKYQGFKNILSYEISLETQIS